jgi:fatty-acyl-CoA synthase
MNHLLTVADAIATHARLQPHKLGARDSRRALSFGQWDERWTRLANALLDAGLVKGDRVALLAYNCVEWVELYVGLARAGLVAVPINFRLTPPEIAYIAEHAEARAFVVQQDLVDQVLPIRDQLNLPSNRWIHLGEAAPPEGWQRYEKLMAQASADAPNV